MEDKISIVVPVYNVEKYIRECVDSLINQTYKNIEIILVDDGSTDKSSLICDEYAKLDIRVKVIHKNNEGVSLARTTGINEAKGKYLCFVDSDDIVSRDYILKMHNQILKHDVSLVIYGNTTAREVFRKKDKNKYKSKILYTNTKEFAKLIVNETINSPCSKLYNLEYINKKKLVFDKNIAIAEDLLFNMSYLQDKVFYSNEPIYWYRKGISDSLSSKYNPDKFKNLMYANNKLTYIFENNKKINCKYINEALQAIIIKNIYSCYKDLIKIRKVSEEEFIKYADEKFIGKIKVKIKYFIFYIEAWFYNRKKFKRIYKIVKKI